MKIQDLTNEELQSVIESYSSVEEHNTIAKIIVIPKLSVVIEVIIDAPNNITINQLNTK